MRRKLAGFSAVGVGLALIGTTLGLSLFKRTQAMESLVGDFRPLVAKPSMDQLDRDLARIDRVVIEQDQKMKPLIAKAMSMTPEQYDAMIAERYPAVDETWSRLPTVLPKYQGLVDSLAAQRERFALTDSIPTKGIPATTMPWAMLGVGAFCIGLGMLTLTRRGVVGPGLAAGVGVVLLALPLALSFPHKAVEADALNRSLKPVVNQELVDEGKAAFGSLAAMGAELDALVAEFAAMFGFTPEQAQPLMAENFPEFTALVADFDATTGRFQSLIADVDANVGNYDLLKNLAFTPFVWLFLLAGLAMTLSGAMAFRLERTLARAVAPVVPGPADPVRSTPM